MHFFTMAFIAHVDSQSMPVTNWKQQQQQMFDTCELLYIYYILPYIIHIYILYTMEWSRCNHTKPKPSPQIGCEFDLLVRFYCSCNTNCVDRVFFVSVVPMIWIFRTGRHSAPSTAGAALDVFQAKCAQYSMVSPRNIQICLVLFSRSTRQTELSSKLYHLIFKPEVAIHLHHYWTYFDFQKLLLAIRIRSLWSAHSKPTSAHLSMLRAFPAFFPFPPSMECLVIHPI